MALLQSLADGRLDLTLALPEAWTIVSDGDDSAQFVDEDHGVMGWLFATPDLHLDLAEDHAQGLLEAAQHHARSCSTPCTPRTMGTTDHRERRIPSGHR